MDLLLVTNARFSQDKNGNIFGHFTSLNPKTLRHYLGVFEKIKIVARVERDFFRNYEDSMIVNKNNIFILPIPSYKGPIDFLLKQKKIKDLIRNYLSGNECVICRVPGSLGRLAANQLKKNKKPYGVEVVGDPYELFAPGSFKSFFRIPLRYLGVLHLKKIVRNSSGAIYVTEKQLQKRYPTRNGVFTTHASNVILPPEAFCEKPRVFSKKLVYTILSIGTLDQMYKAPDLLLKLVKKINTKKLGFSVRLWWLGDGKHKIRLISEAKKMGLGNGVCFFGMIKSAETVRDYIDKADIFVLASRTEGLPRAMIEAMARGIPCIGTNIGGIPELLSNKHLIAVDNLGLLEEKIINLLTNKSYYEKASKENLKKSNLYSLDQLNQRRFSFYEHLVSLTQNHQ